ncbi:amino acid ABC transporter substrate-binding protein [Anaerostipes sp. MSJ-23]|uniref:amino acid ABC transporter substrate-binding protein n=1 Tax=unclassified Anaerostipes TaxID=2635253 RepID=UPI001C105B77|nr:amino acid ABC transporter substrate-binding protein [Anaerostipes sp. MSJ-23]MBU5459440.1 amino acid ABC transporter substrate-binding protein [Anaerostipes sp. MSJ-23]
MKKIIVGLLTVALAASLLVGCGSKKSSSKKDDSLTKVKDKKELILGLDASFPPMGFTDKNQKIVGFDIDLAKEVTKRMGIKLKLQPINWDSKEQELDTGNIDCIWNGLTYNKDRAKQMLCSEPYMENHQVLVVPANSKIKSLADVKKQSLGVQKGSTAADAVDQAKQLKDANVTLMSDNVQILNDLGNGLQAAVMDEVVAKYYTAKDTGKYKVLSSDLATENYVIGFRKDDKALCNEVVKQLKAMAKDGTLAKISKKWFQEDITTIK